MLERIHVKTLGVQLGFSRLTGVIFYRGSHRSFSNIELNDCGIGGRIVEYFVRFLFDLAVC